MNNFYADSYKALGPIFKKYVQVPSGKNDSEEGQMEQINKSVIPIEGVIEYLKSLEASGTTHMTFGVCKDSIYIKAFMYRNNYVDFENTSHKNIMDMIALDDLQDPKRITYAGVQHGPIDVSGKTVFTSDQTAPEGPYSDMSDQVWLCKEGVYYSYIDMRKFYTNVLVKEIINL